MGDLFEIDRGALIGQPKMNTSLSLDAPMMREGPVVRLVSRKRSAQQQLFALSALRLGTFVLKSINKSLQIKVQISIQAIQRSPQILPRKSMPQSKRRKQSVNRKDSRSPQKIKKDHARSKKAKEAPENNNGPPLSFLKKKLPKDDGKQD